MILADTSVWVDHFRARDKRLSELLERGAIVMHPFVLGELACGNLTKRSAVLELLGDLPMAITAETDEVLSFIEHHRLHGKGIGYVDVHLLASTSLGQDVQLWSRDKRLAGVAHALGYAYRTVAH